MKGAASAGARPGRARRRRPGPAGASLALALLLAAGAARADAPADARAQASTFFDAGAQAYDAGEYLVAAEAFERAHALVPSPSLLFSAAQAYRRQVLTQPSPDALQRAVALYRAYLRADPKAKRREDAIAALEALAPIEARLSPPAAPPAEGPAPASAPATPATPASAAVPATRLLLTARPDSAQVSLDGGPFRPTPVVAGVEPGPHVVRVRAEGYHEEQLAVGALPNELVPRHVVLRPKPARLRVTGTSGARVAVDGQVRATVPTDTPLAVDPGVHFLAVTLPGHEPYSARIELGRDQATSLVADLPPTPQRIAAWAALSAGAAGAVASSVLTGLALSRQGDAVALRDQRAAGALTTEERDRYNGAVMARDDLALAAGVAGGLSALTLVAGVGLLVLDDPEAPTPPEAPAEPPPRTEFTVGALSLGLRVGF
jgi:tetratricopeptide (TPR) repeat protein